MKLRSIDDLLKQIKEEGEYPLTEFTKAYGAFEKQVLDYRLNHNIILKTDIDENVFSRYWKIFCYKNTDSSINFIEMQNTSTRLTDYIEDWFSDIYKKNISEDDISTMTYFLEAM